MLGDFHNEESRKRLQSRRVATEAQSTRHGYSVVGRNARQLRNAHV